ncbi:MAG: hypothetical protein EPGJADBJ_01354 [Saprospiraceae bacterium]|nr:hypothetical protein [Saprospiraceae bacterium]
MITLDEYLGALVSNLSQARALADLESARIAGAYAENALLKHFSIPRMKIEEVELNVLVAIDEIICDAIEEDKPIDKKKFAALTYTTILSTLEVGALPADTSKDINSEIAKHIDKLVCKVTKENADDLLYEYASGISQFVFKYMNRLMENGTMPGKDNKEKIMISHRLTESLLHNLKGQIKFDPNPSQLKRIKVTVESDKLKERPSNSLLVLKMKISEEGMTWERIEDSEGNLITKLMPY